MSQPSESRFGWLTSVAFWVCLLAAGTLYAMAALSPALLANLQLTQRYCGTQRRLVALEREDLRMQQVVHALKTDPRYSQELARQDFNGVAEAADEQRLPLEGDLAHDMQPAVSSVAIEDPELPWFAPVLSALVQDRGANSTLLIVSAVVVVYAFGFLQPGSSRSNCQAEEKTVCE